jgi:uncharacterized protein
MGDVSNEPSMEEILSSIKRIIAEDSEAALSPPRNRRASAPQPVADPVPVADESDDEPEVLELTEAVAPEAETETPEAIAEETPMPVAEAKSKPALVSDKATEASRSSLAALSALIVKPEVTGGDTLEGLVREMLKPMLAEWLESRLPGVVERMVAQEIRRITDRG